MIKYNVYLIHAKSNKLEKLLGTFTSSKSAFDFCISEVSNYGLAYRLQVIEE